MSSIEVGEAARVLEVRFVVECGVERGVPAGSGVGGFRPGQDHGIGRAGQARLNAGARLAKMDCVRADIAHFENPLFAERALEGEVPLLSIGNFEVARHGETENKLRGQNAGTAAGAAIIWKLCCISARESLKNTETRNEVRVQDSGLRQRVDAGQKEIRQRSGIAAAESNGKIRRLETELIHGADVFADKVDAIAGAICGVVYDELFVRKVDTRIELAR